MQWRIIVPVLCLIGILHVPGNVAQTTISTVTTGNGTSGSSVTNTSTNPITNQTTVSVAGAANGTNQTTVSVAGATNGTNQTTVSVAGATNGTNQTTVSVSGATNGTNQTTVSTTSTTQAATTASTPGVAKFNLQFRILQLFLKNYNNLSDPLTVSLTNNITAQCGAVYKSKFANFIGMTVTGLSNGSIVVNSSLSFNTTNASSPNSNALSSTLTTAIANGNFTFSIDNTSVSATPASTSTSTTTTSSRSPALTGMLTALWMILASLLFSFVMH